MNPKLSVALALLWTAAFAQDPVASDGDKQMAVSVRCVRD